MSTLEKLVGEVVRETNRSPRAVVRLPVLDDGDRRAWRDLVSAIGAVVHIHESVAEYVEEVAEALAESPTVSLAGLCGTGRAVYNYGTRPVTIPLSVGTMVLGTAAVVSVARELELYPAEAIASFALDPDYKDRINRLVVRLPTPVKRADAQAPEDPDVVLPEPKHYWFPSKGAKRAKYAFRP